MSKSVRALLIAICAVLITLLSLQMGVCASEEIGLSLEYVQDAMPGSFATIVAHLLNKSDKQASFLAEFIVPEGWDLLPYNKEILVEPQTAEALFFTVHIPQTQLADTYPLYLKLTSKDSGEEYLAEATIKVAKNRMIDIIADMGPSLYPGESGYHSFIIRNTGNTKEELTIEAFPMIGWNAGKLSPSNPLEVVLNPGESFEAGYSVSVPKDAEPGIKDYLSVTAKASDNQLQLSAILSLIVLPPTPESIPPLRPDTIPAVFTVSTGGTPRDIIEDIDMSLRASGSILEDTYIDLSSRLRAEDVWRNNESNLWLLYKKGPLSFEMGLDSKVNRWTDNFFRVRYEVDNWAVTLGDLALGLPPIIRTKARGVEFSIINRDRKFSIFAFGRSTGVTASNKFDNGAYRLLLMREWNTGRDIVSAYAERRLTDILSVNGDITFVDNSTSFSVGATYSTDPLYINGKYFYYGKMFEDLHGERNGYELSLVSRTARFPVQFDYYNVISRQSLTDDTLIRTKYASLGADIPIGPFMLVAAVCGDEEKTIASSNQDDDIVDRRYWSSVIGLEQNFDNWFWAMRAMHEHEYDKANDMRLAWVSYTPEIGFYWDRASVAVGYGFFGVGETVSEARRNLSPSSVLDFTYHPDSWVLDYFTLRYYKSDISMLMLRGKLNLDKDGSLSVNGRARAIYNGPQPEWTFRLGLTKRFDLPIIGVYSKGKIKGRVYIEDLNIGVERLVLMIGNNEVSTGKDGYFEFPPLPAGTYNIEIGSLPLNYELPVEMPITVELAAGKTEDISIPLRRVSQISGHVFYDSTREKATYSSAAEIPEVLSGVRIELWKDGALIESVLTNVDGRYMFRTLLDGEYEIRLATETLPSRIEIVSTNPVKITIRPEENRRIDFMVAEKALDIELTFEAEI